MLHVAEMLTQTKCDLTEALFLFLMVARLVQTTLLFQDRREIDQVLKLHKSHVTVWIFS